MSALGCPWSLECSIKLALFPVEGVVREHSLALFPVECVVREHGLTSFSKEALLSILDPPPFRSAEA